jgi:hypothetical protein
VGLVGFILSLCGLLFACLFPIGMIVSLCGLGKQPKGFAIAGTVIGAVGTLLLILIFVLYGAMIAACIGVASSMQPVIDTQSALSEAEGQIDQWEIDNGELPDETVGNELISGINDGWERPLRYELSEDAVNGYVVRSAGADGEFDTDDDSTTEDYGSGIDYDFDYDTSDDDDYEIEIDDSTMEDGPWQEEPGIQMESDVGSGTGDESDSIDDLFGPPRETTDSNVPEDGGS